jgi:hypothetical protein
MSQFGYDSLLVSAVGNDPLGEEIKEILSLDPKPQYQNDEERIYGLSYKNFHIKFSYKDEHRARAWKAREDKADGPHRRRGGFG